MGKVPHLETLKNSIRWKRRYKWLPENQRPTRASNVQGK